MRWKWRCADAVCPQECFATVTREVSIVLATIEIGCDNACMESYFHAMKVEAIHYELMMHREPLRQHVFEYIEVDYNRRLRLSALD